MRDILSAAVCLFAILGGGEALALSNGWCSGVHEAAETSALRLARVSGKASRVHFVSNPGDTEKTKDCPSSAAVCRRAGFVTPGDYVLVDDIRGDLACASYVSAKVVETGGWLPLASLDILAQPAEQKSANWLGRWRRAEAEIVMKASGELIGVSGAATWGGSDPRRVKTGSVHTGEFDGKVQPRGNMLAIGEGYGGEKAPDEKAGTCQVRLRHFGVYLVVEDNHRCGGANVSFEGVYIRSKAALPIGDR